MNDIFSEFKGAFNRPNNAHVQLILINLAVFVVMITFRVFLTISGNADVYNAILRQFMLPADIGAFLVKPWTLITYFFLHEGFWHILFNMLFLYWFGRLINEFLGSKKVVNLYVLGGVIGGLTYILMYNIFPFFQDRIAGSVMLGASAGVFAIVVGAATYMPNYTFFLIFLGPVKIKYIALFYVFLSFANSVGANAGGEIAHLGGALIGFFYMRQLQQGNDIGRPIQSVLEFVKGLFKPSPKIKVTYTQTKSKAGKSTPPSRTASEQAEIDAILDKISESGYESLSKEEKQKLFNASKK